MLLLGLLDALVDHKMPSLLMGYMLMAMIGFPFNAVASMRKESASKWSQYKLTTPVKRSAIVQSYFYSLLIWLTVGMVYAGIGVLLRIMLYGFPFYVIYGRNWNQPVYECHIFSSVLLGWGRTK